MSTSLVRVSNKVHQELVKIQDKKKSKHHRQVPMTEVIADLIKLYKVEK